MWKENEGKVVVSCDNFLWFRTVGEESTEKKKGVVFRGVKVRGNPEKEEEEAEEGTETTRGSGRGCSFSERKLFCDFL